MAKKKLPAKTKPATRTTPAAAPKGTQALARRQPPQPPKGTKRNPTNQQGSAGKGPVQNRVRRWERRLRSAHAKYDKWAEQFEVKRLEQYVEGKQWKGLTETEAAKKYVINMFFATEMAQLPTLLFSKPKIECDARPNVTQIQASDIAGRATTIEQLLQTIVDDPETHFGFITSLALQDAYPRFGLIEVGYTADFIDNPNADRPMLDEDDQPLKDDDGEPVREPKLTLKPGSKESIYVKRIPPQDFRCGPATNNLLVYNDWYAIGEWADLADVKANKAYKNTATLKATGVSRWEEGDTEEVQHDRTSIDDKDTRGKVRLWKIYDLRLKVKHVIAEGHPDYLLEKEPMPFPSHAMLKFFERGDSLYPIPVAYPWIGPQDEINESREMARVHRRRAIRRYLRETRMKNVEFEKLETGEDMVVATVDSVDPPPLIPVQDAPLDPGFWTELAATKDDFAVVSGVTGEARATPEADTATQANIVNVRQQVRESRARQQVADWLAEIVRLILLNVKEYMQLDMLVKKTVDPMNFDPQQMVARMIEWARIKMEDIEDLDVDIRIDVTSLSPVAEDIQRAAWNVVLGFLTNPQMIMVLFEPSPTSPSSPSPLLRKTLSLNGIKNEAEIQEIFRVGVILKAQLTAMIAATAAQKGGMPMGGGMMPQMTLPGAGGGATGGSTGKPTAPPGGAV